MIYLFYIEIKKGVLYELLFNLKHIFFIQDNADYCGDTRGED